MPRQQCDRRDRSAASIRELTYADDKYKTSLCKAHDAELLRLVARWTNLAEEQVDFTYLMPGDECDRCQWAAKVSKSLGWQGEVYRLRLCERHADLLSEDMLPWMREATILSTDWITKVIQLPVPTGARQRALVMATADEEPVDHVMPIGAEEWHMTRHAQLRLEQRGPKFGFDAKDVMLACLNPTIRRPAPSKPGAWLYAAGPVQTVVNPTTKVVITVGPYTPGQTYEQYELKEAQ